MNEEYNLITTENIQGELIKNEIEQNNLKLQAFKEQKFNELLKENNQLKESLHQASIEIQELIEQDIECPSSCHKLKELRSWLEEEINNIETLFGGETSMTIGYKTVLSKLNELEGGKNDSKRDV